MLGDTANLLAVPEGQEEGLQSDNERASLLSFGPRQRVAWAT
jgi:hypothetical protein